MNSVVQWAAAAKLHQLTVHGDGIVDVQLSCQVLLREIALIDVETCVELRKHVQVHVLKAL